MELFLGLLLFVSPQVVPVWRNNIEGKGLVALSQSMKTNPTLSHISTSGETNLMKLHVVSLSSLRFFPGPTTSDVIY